MTRRTTRDKDSYLRLVSEKKMNGDERVEKNLVDLKCFCIARSPLKTKTRKEEREKKKKRSFSLFYFNAMSKVQPPELKKLMDKKLSGTRGKGAVEAVEDKGRKRGSMMRQQRRRRRQ